jgi:hypothetical protein
MRAIHKIARKASETDPRPMVFTAPPFELFPTLAGADRARPAPSPSTSLP